MSEKMTHEELAEEHRQGNFEALHPEALGYVNLTLKRMIERGLLVQEQIDADLIQEANLAAMEACRSWQSLSSTLGSWAEVCIRGAVQNHLLALSTGMIGGRPSGYPTVSTSEPLSTEEPDDPSTLGESLEYLEPPEGLGNPFDEVVRLQDIEKARALVASLSLEDRELVRAVYGIGQPQETQGGYAVRKGLHRVTVADRLTVIRTILLHRA